MFFDNVNEKVLCDCIKSIKVIMSMESSHNMWKPNMCVFVCVKQYFSSYL